MEYYKLHKITSFQRRGNALQARRDAKDKTVRYEISPRKDGWWLLTEYKPVNLLEAMTMLVAGREKIYGSEIKNLDWY